MTPPLCAHCEARPATHFAEDGADYDPACDACYDARFGICANCGAEVPLDDLGLIEVRRESRFGGPGEAEPRCAVCCRATAEDDADREYDAWKDGAL